VSRQDPLVVFTPSGKRGRFPVGTPLLAAARTLGVDIDSVCGGRAICGRCQILVAEGEFAKHGVSSSAASLSPVSVTEERYGGAQATCAGPSPVVPGKGRSGRRGRRAREQPGATARSCARRAEARDIELYPLVKLHYVEVAEPDMHDPTGDLQRLEKALAREWQLERPRMRPVGVAAVAGRAAGRPVAGHRGSARCVAHHCGAGPDSTKTAYGLAVDVGSTTHRRTPVRSRQRRSDQVRGAHEPADPLRRRPDEPRFVFDDEPGWRRADDGRRARCPE
jgi:uncharacterized 2Fe-2S/4Fe-4S cluster protein (DUF4445 family)